MPIRSEATPLSIRGHTLRFFNWPISVSSRSGEGDTSIPRSTPDEAVNDVSERTFEGYPPSTTPENKE